MAFRRWLVCSLTVCVAACGTPAPAESPRSVSGAGSTTSAPFTLAGGTYSMLFAVPPEDPSGCFASGWLANSNAGGTALALLPVVNSSATAPASGTSYADGVAAGSYVVSVDAVCTWTVTISPSR